MSKAATGDATAPEGPQPALPRLRERQKMKRRQAILDAARELFSRYGGDNISAEQIAAAADVSAPTLYNLIGTRDQLLAALLDELLGAVESELTCLVTSDPLERGAEVVEICVQQFIVQDSVFRYVVRKLIALEQLSEVQTNHDAVLIQDAIMREAQTQELIGAQWDTFQIAMQIYRSFTGAMMLWAGRLLSNEQFRDQARYGYWASLAGFASDRSRALVLQRLLEVQRRLQPPLPAASGR